MSILERQKAKKEHQKQEVVQAKKDNTTNLTVQEIEFLIRLVGSSNFKGNDLMFVYDLVKKLQDEFLRKSGGE